MMNWIHHGSWSLSSARQPPEKMLCRSFWLIYPASHLWEEKHTLVPPAEPGGLKLSVSCFTYLSPFIRYSSVTWIWDIAGGRQRGCMRDETEKRQHSDETTSCCIRLNITSKLWKLCLEREQNKIWVPLIYSKVSCSLGFSRHPAWSQHVTSHPEWSSFLIFKQGCPTIMHVNEQICYSLLSSLLLFKHQPKLHFKGLRCARLSSFSVRRKEEWENNFKLIFRLN